MRALIYKLSDCQVRVRAGGPGMARQLRFQYPGAVYHVMARGDGGRQLFLGKEDHELFRHWLEQVCGSHGWRVHAWVLMGNPL
jgi:REP element-mobilizing transposase RayT